MQRDHTSQDGGRWTPDAALIQFFSVNLMHTADGRVSVGVMATLCEKEGELEGMDLGSHTVDSLDEALAIIRDALAFVH
jgi:hypothetical protein